MFARGGGPGREWVGDLDQHAGHAPGRIDLAQQAHDAARADVDALADALPDLDRCTDVCAADPGDREVHDAARHQRWPIDY